MNVSNKILSILLIVAFIVSTSSIIINLYKIDSITHTAKATTEHGFIMLDIRGDLSITTRDSPYISFGNCELLDYDFNITSEGTKDTYDSCQDFYPNNISVRNDGNIPASVWIKSNVVGAKRGGTFLNSSSENSDLAYKVSNEGRETPLGVLNHGGCFGNIGPFEYTPFFEADTLYLVCDYLNVASLGGQNSVVINFEVAIPQDIEIGFSEVTITFIAEANI